MSGACDRVQRGPPHNENAQSPATSSSAGSARLA